jgi:hypothetical protein
VRNLLQLCLQIATFSVLTPLLSIKPGSYNLSEFMAATRLTSAPAFRMEDWNPGAEYGCLFHSTTNYETFCLIRHDGTAGRRRLVNTPVSFRRRH